MSREPGSRVDSIGRRIVAMVIVLALLPAVLIAVQLRGMTRDALAPELHAKAAAVAQSAARQIDHAVSLGIPVRELVGMREFLSGLRESDPDVGYIAVAIGPQLLHSAGPAPAALAESAAGTTVSGDWYDTQVATADGEARVHVGIARALVDRELDSMLYDLLIVFVASTLVGFEILLFIMARHLLAPIALMRAVVDDGCEGRFGQLVAIAGSDPLGRLAMAVNHAVRRLSLRQARLAAVAADLGERAGAVRKAIEDAGRRMSPGGGEPVWKSVPVGTTVVRAPVFLFVLSEEMSRSFLPLFASELVPAGAAELKSMAISLPLSVYMAAFLASSLLAGPLIERHGARRVFLGGAILACLAFAATAAAVGLWDFVLWRALSGTGYGLMFIAAQTEVIDNSPPEKRSQNLSVLIGAIFAAAICGASIGGVLAERAGFRATFVVSATLTAAAAITAWGVMSRGLGPAEDRAPFWTLIGIFRNRRFLALALFASIPAKMVLAGFLFYLVPLILAAEHDPSTIGRMVMVYPLLMVAGVPLFGRYSAGPSRNFALVSAGGLVVGLGVATLWWGGGLMAVLLAVAALGLGQGLSNSAQVALVSDYCAEECRRYGNAAVLSVFRLTERAGSILGPLLAAALAGPLGYGGAAASLGLVVAASTLLLGVLVLSGRGDARRNLG